MVLEKLQMISALYHEKLQVEDHGPLAKGYVAQVVGLCQSTFSKVYAAHPPCY